MEQVLLKKAEPEFELKTEVLEEVPVKLELLEETKPVEQLKPVKKLLLKFLNKSKYNAKYMEELVTPNAAKRNVQYRNYGNF